MKYKMTDERWEAIMRYINYTIKHPEKTSDRGVILSLSDEEVSRLFTKKRIELVNVIKRKRPKSVSELSKIVERKPTAVERDLRVLEGFGIVRMEKKGRVARPIVESEAIILPLASVTPKKVKGLAYA